ncbi:MAG TPA: cupin-like domain-containing protein [Gemmataceae bacterium]|nr:cupin-like domain-containing protein [Gemmataceae bacterium]
MTPTLPAEQLPWAGPSVSKGPYFILDPDAFLPCFNERACLVRHRLVDHPLLALPRLLELAKQLPPKYVRINSGNVAINATPAQIPGNGLSMEDSFQRIEETDTRIMLKKIELVTEYRELLHSCIAELEAFGHPATRGIWAREGYVFISAPNQTTPYHMDPEINFLLQIRGRKTFHVLPGDDRSILSEQDIELFYTGLHQSLPFLDDAPHRAEPFAMNPGDGVHIPVNHPHWVSTENEVTISFAVTLQTEETRRRGAIYAVNHSLRRLSIKPAPYGRCTARDFLKYQGYRLWNGLSSCLPRRRHDARH